MTQQTLAEDNGNLPGLPVAKLALWLFLAVATMLFAMLLSAYLVRMGLAEEHTLSKPALLWLNTLLLALSSLALEGARRAALWGAGARLRYLWLTGGALAMLFLVGQLFAWRELAQAGYFLATNPASSFFYLLTTLHGLHLLGGLIAWARVLLHSHPSLTLPVDGEGTGGVRARVLNVELCALYWHFLLVIWIVMLGLIWVTT